MATQKLPSIKKNFFYNTLYQILILITPFITAPYLSRVLGADKIGLYSYTYSIAFYFLLFCSLGTVSYGAREISRTRDDKELRSKLFFEIELLTIFTSSISLIFWIIYIICNPSYKQINCIYIISILSSMLNISWFFTGLENFKSIVTKNSIVKISGIILILLLVKKPEDLWIYILIVVSADFLGNVSMWLSLKKYIVKIDFHSINIWPHFKETLVYFIPSIASSIYLVLDKTLIGIITQDNSQNGFYEEANKIIGIVKTLCFSSITSVMGSRTSYLYKENKIDEIKLKIEQTLDFILFMSIGSCFGLIGVANNFVPFFFGETFKPSIILLQLMSPTVIIISISILMCNLYFVPAGLRKKSCFFEISGAVLNLLLNIILIYNFKSAGAVIATICAEFLISALYVIFSDKFLTLSIIIKYSWKKIISASLMLIYLLLLNKINFPSYLVALVVQISGGSLIYVITLLILKDSNIFRIYRKIFKRKKK